MAEVWDFVLVAGIVGFVVIISGIPQPWTGGFKVYGM